MYNDLRNFIDLGAVETAVFWDMLECPIPENLDVGSVSRNIRESLKKAGFNCTANIYAFSDTSQSREGFVKADVVFNRLPPGDDYVKLDMILSEFSFWAVRHRAPANILLILGDISEHNEYFKTFHLLRNKQYNCMLAQRVHSKVLYDRHSLSTTWLWDSLALGGDALPSLQPAGDSSCSQGVSEEPSLCKENESNPKY